jgi:hypothetical protein
MGNFQDFYKMDKIYIFIFPDFVAHILGFWSLPVGVAEGVDTAVHWGFEVVPHPEGQHSWAAQGRPPPSPWWACASS